MSRRANPALIGAFVLGALVVAMGAIAILGTGALFSRTQRYVIFFDGNLSGLDVGAPVEYRGVQVGRVSDIRLEYHPATMETRTPVHIAFDPARIKVIGPQAESLGLSNLIEAGLRAQLQIDSLLTGKQKIMLVDRPDTPANRVETESDVPQLPTIPTLTASLAEQMQNIPFDEMVSNINTSLREIAHIAQSPEWDQALSAMERSAVDLESLLSHMDQTLPGLASNLMQTSRQMDRTLAEARSVLDPRSPVRYELTAAMEEVGAAAQAVRELVDYLQRHPEALIRGKQENEE